MIKIRGSSYRPIYLPELNDTVFFGQIKVYQKEQVSRSPTLQEAMRRGGVAVLDASGTVEQVSMSNTQAVPPTPAPYVPAPTVAPPPEVKPAEPAQMSPEAQALITSLMEKVSALSKTLESKQTRDDVGVTQSDISDKLAALATKIDGMRVTGPGVQESSMGPSSHSDDFMFVPSAIKVDDLTNNISLATRSLGQGGSVNEASAALKKARLANSNKGA